VLLLITNAVQLPKGTHQWSSFLTPEELVLIHEKGKSFNLMVFML
jgi:2-polyprenyl-3-methyl-5-hydroxy-6-metoxy-1,4-benzoquinol methylase